MAKIESNCLVPVNAETLYRTKPRSDRHSLIVTDRNDFEVLNIRYLNRTTFRFTGTLRSPEGGQVTITDSDIIGPDGTVVRSTMRVGGTGGLLHFTSNRVMVAPW